MFVLGDVFLLPVLWQTHLSPSLARNWWCQSGCYGGWSILNTIHVAVAVVQSFHKFFLMILLSLFFRMGFPGFHAWWLLLCCQIWNIHKLIIRWTLDSFQVNLNCNYWILFRTCEDVLADAGDLGGDFLRRFAPVLTGSRLWASSQASSRCSSG